jgi:hypothetical protein
MTGTDETLTAATDKRKNKLIRLIIASGWALTLLTMVGIVWTGLVLIAFKGHVDLPDVLKQWGGLALGFLFGSFPNIVKEYMDD